MVISKDHLHRPSKKEHLTGFLKPMLVEAAVIRSDGSVFCIAFDLIELNGDDMPRVMQAAEATLTLSCQGTITVR